MDANVRNIDDEVYKRLRALAVLEGRAVGELISEAIRGYLIRVDDIQKRGSLRDLRPEPFPEGNELLSAEIDSLLYGLND
ncbi:MAG: hypothetical protein JOY62_15240 [Acidobacteriaceae bacterium]|nr:hypothetical protein [Acidobacteriaceae bacterium]MBV9781317.1 hypothetical protein [Acidobacteriaceae bacterium]